MLEQLNKQLILLIITILVNINIFSQNSIIENIESDVELRNASIGIYAINAKSGEVIVDYNSNKNLKPASNLKLLTTIAALNVLGANTRFETKLMYSGYFDENTLVGDLYIIGGGDPTMASKYFNKNKFSFIDEWIAALKKAHINIIDGDLIVVDTLFKGNATPSTWVWGDIGNYYGAGVSSIAIFDNQYELFFNTKVKDNDTVKFLKIVPNININLTNKVIATKVKKDKSNIYGSELSNNRVISGELPINKKEYIVKGSILNPELVLADTTKGLLEKNGFIIKGKTRVTNILNAKPRLNLLATHLSPTVLDIVKVTNLYSVNVYAEMLLRHIDKKLGGNGKNISATNNLKSYWVKNGLNKSNIRFYDGSGLSSYNLISAKQLVKALSVSYNDTALFAQIKQSLPISGETGTLKYTFNSPKLKGKIHAKSGTMSAVKAYSGYIILEDVNNTIIFSIIFNNFTNKSKSIKNKINEILTKLSQ